jgi:hypothetical protein
MKIQGVKDFMGRLCTIAMTLLLVCSCSNKMKEKIGIVTSGPDEYKVQKSKPLDVPPHYDLPAPTTHQPINEVDTLEQNK